MYLRSNLSRKCLQASCQLAFPSHDEDYAWYLAQRGLHNCCSRCTPKATLDVTHDEANRAITFPLKRWLYLARSGSSANRWSCEVLNRGTCHLYCCMQVQEGAIYIACSAETQLGNLSLQKLRMIHQSQNRLAQSSWVTLPSTQDINV